MAVKDRIKYLQVDFDTTDWEDKHIYSPFRSPDKHKHRVMSNIVDMEAVSRDINWTTLGSGHTRSSWTAQSRLRISRASSV
jgi:hypothetical protein